MARALEFVFKGSRFKGTIEKVDRAALYGSVDVETRDRNGLRCQVATLASDGRTLIQSGGTAIAYFSPKGEWLERSSLSAVDERGARVNSVPSSFDVPIELEMRTTPDRFLDHSIRLTYAVDALDPVPEALKTELDGGAIFKFDFSYRGGANADPAFLLKGADGTLWMLAGTENNFNFVAFTQAAGLADAEEVDGASDDLDFEMM